MNSVVFGIFTWQRLLFFVAGIAASWLWNLYTSRRDRKPAANPNYVGIIAGVSVMVFIAISQVNLSYEVARCQQELVGALDVRASLAAKNDDLSEQQRKLLLDDNIALGDWIGKLLDPPMPRDDPAYRNWALGITQEYYEHTNALRSHLKDIQNEVDHIRDERDKHPLPEPSCGRRQP
jgi:hypothetical protein